MGVKVKGPLGTLKLTLPSFSKLDYNEETRRVTFSVLDVMDKKQKSMWAVSDADIGPGTIRQLFNNTVLGVSEGHISILRMVGVGFRATVEPIKTAATTNIKEEFPDQQFINLKVGYAHPIELPVPRGIKASTPQPTMILLEGTEKQAVKQFAAEIREWRRPEPYKGKGIFVDEETIRLKAKKIK
ncbi:hypothetical protein KEM55_001900 [Ascosphaera atra]|nr:hypothetical protein KEM55_001900 [Ascosphaera atra]